MSRERYVIEGTLGAGGQGHTYRARDQQTGEAVAVKVIRLRGDEGWKPFDLFERECRVLRSLDHPGIPRLIDTFSDEAAGEFFLVMALVEGQNLLAQLNAGAPAAEAQLWSVLHQTLDILDYLHSRHPPVIHRDVKPANLILSDAGKVTLVDFGGVRVALRPDGGSTVVGTFGYMAPEQLHGEATPATDIFGLGATVASLAAGVEADKLPRAGLKVDLSSVMADSPLRAVLLRMLEPDPSHRLMSAAAVRKVAAAGVAPIHAAPIHAAASPPRPEDDGAVGTIVRVIGSMGFVGLVLVETVMLPLVFMLLSALGRRKPSWRRALKPPEQAIRKTIGEGRRAMKSLAQGRDPQRALPPRSDRRPPQPPGRRGRGGNRRGQ